MSNQKVDFYFDKQTKWQEQIALLRAIVNDCGLDEELKWGCPCYTFQNKNIVLIHIFKEYCAFLFFKGALLSDTHKMLVQQTENVQAARQIRFNSSTQIKDLSPTLKQYIFEAITVEQAGLKVELKQTKEYAVPTEFQNILQINPPLKTAFESLTPGRQRGYILHFSTPKQSSTRVSRIEKCIPQILEGKGLND